MDAVQETYIKIVKNISSLNDETLFIAWANKIAYSICIRMLSKNKPTLIDDDFLHSIADDNESNNPSVLLEGSEKAKTLAIFIDRLDPVLRSTLIFKYFNDLKIKQIAEIMECPEGTVKSRLNTSKKLLKTMIKQDRKGGIILGAFAYFSLREAFILSANYTPMASQASTVVFKSVLTQSNITSNLSFNQQLVFNPSKNSLSATIVGSSVMCVSAIALTITATFIPPVISNVEIHQPNVGYVRAPISITAQIDAPLKTITQTYLTSDDRELIYGVLDNENIATFYVIENGLYTLHAFTPTNLEATTQITIANIDNIAPEIISFTNTNDKLIIEVFDNDSGVDFNGMYGETASGQQFYPISFDQSAKTITFEIPQENARLSISDLCGNISYHNVILD